MTEAFLPIENGELLMPSPPLPNATEQNNTPFDNLLTILQDASQNNASPSPVPMSNRENEKIFSSDVPPSIEGNKKTEPNKGGTNSPAFPSFFSDICNFFSIAGNLLLNIEKDSNQGVMIKDNREGTLSYGIESPDRNTSSKYHLLKDARVFNATPFFRSITKQEDPVLQAAKGIMPPDDTRSFQGNNIQTDLFETILKPLSDNEILLPQEQYEHSQFMDKEDNCIIPAQMNSPSRKDLNGILFSLEQHGREWLMDKEENYPKPVELNSFSPKDLQVVSSLKANGDNQLNTGFPKDQCMILQGDRNNDAHILSGKLYLKAFVDTGSSSPPEAQGDQLIHTKVTDTPKYSLLKNEEPKINTVPYATGGEGKNNTGLREKLHMMDPKGFSPILFEEIQSPLTPTSLKLPTASETAPLIEDPLKSEGSGDKGHSKTTSPDATITQAEDIFSLVDNKNRNENSPLRVNTLREPLHVDTFVLPKKGDATIEVSLEPEGMGQIDIELTLDRGVINAQINASDIIGKDIIERNLHAILSALIDEGLNIGNFSVSLRNKQGDVNDNKRQEELKMQPVIKTREIPLGLSHNRIISIFV